jgi:hypothetical protein
MAPGSFVFLERLPLTANGKVDRDALPEPGSARPELDDEYAVPATATEEVLAAIWSQVLGVDEVGVMDNFFSLGGDSIRSVQVVGLAKERGFSFTVKDLFQYQTIRALAQQANLNSSAEAETIRTEPFSLISEEDRLRIPDGIEDAYPLTMLQTGMIYHMQMDANAPIYHNVSSWHVRVHFDEKLFEKAVQQVVARHPVLRTSFDLTNYSTALQMVHREAYLPVPVEDMRHLPPGEQEEALAAYFERVKRQVFDFSSPPLLRYDIHRRTDDTIQLTLVECHPIIDGWSTTYTLAEIFARYFKLLDDEPVEDDPIPVTFRDYVRLEQMALESEEAQNFWRDKLDGRRVTKLPRWPSATLSRSGERNRVRVITFAADVYEGLKRLAKEAVVPIKSVLLAAHIKVLSLACNTNDIVTGLSVNGRMEEAGGEQVRGLFLNVVPFRQHVREGTWADLVKDTYGTELEILAYRRYPLAAMQQRFGSGPIFETIFNYLHFHSVESVLKSGRIEILDSRDLSETNFVQMAGYQVDPVSSRLILRLHFDIYELGDSQISALADCYIKTLNAMACDPGGLHTELSVQDVLTDHERGVLKESTRIDEMDATFSF